MESQTITTVDARGLKCPLPVLRLRKVALSLEKGARLEIIADDPAAARDIPAFAKEMGWQTEAIAPERWYILI